MKRPGAIRTLLVLPCLAALFLSRVLAGSAPALAGEAGEGLPIDLAAEVRFYYDNTEYKGR